MITIGYNCISSLHLSHHLKILLFKIKHSLICKWANVFTSLWHGNENIPGSKTCMTKLSHWNEIRLPRNHFFHQNKVTTSENTQHTGVLGVLGMGLGNTLIESLSTSVSMRLVRDSLLTVLSAMTSLNILLSWHVATSLQTLWTKKHVKRDSVY